MIIIYNDGFYNLEVTGLNKRNINFFGREYDIVINTPDRRVDLSFSYCLARDNALKLLKEGVIADASKVDLDKMEITK